ncbi:uncharacterized protein LOC111617623, partial [Centruroides sculpturatus]|uniref:uncharacterized protein LOC111617623 n=1 Tax=Centruroides sculpturatus TaxID=218467 RepID=UPI000C6E996E
MPDIKIGRTMRVGKKKSNSPRKRILELKPDGVYVNDDFSPRYDIVFLSETWYASTNRNSDLTDCLQGYNLHFGKAFKLHAKGRHCAGWLLAIRSSFPCVVVYQDAFLILVKFGAELGNILVCFVYFRENDWQTIFDTLTGLLLDNRNVLIAGDFNARIGLENIISDSFCNSFGIVCPLRRNSKDLVIDSCGRKLLHLCDDLDMIIVNGRCLGDEAGEYSFISNRGCSVIDLVIVSPLIWKDILSLTVDQCLDSDHNPLILRLVGGNERSVSVEKRQKINRLFWDESRKDELRLAMEEICTTNKFDLMEDLSDCLFSLACKWGFNIRRNKNYFSWFDSDCRMLISARNRAWRSFRKSNDSNDRFRFVMLRSLAKRFCIAKKKLFAGKIQNCFRRDNRLFWNYFRHVKQAKSCNFSFIPIDDWFHHFFNLFGFLDPYFADISIFNYCRN